jgi:hypothetical protein
MNRLVIGKSVYLEIMARLGKSVRDRSKLIPKIIIDKNGHARKVYVRMGLSAKKTTEGGTTENMDSTERAKTLKIEDFGTLEEVREMAKTSREAHSYDEARSMLRELVNKSLKSRSGLEATVSMNSIDKILSGKAVDKSLDGEAHFLVAANLEKLFSNAVEPFKFPFNPEKHNENYREVRRLYAPMAYKGRIIPVKFTVIEMMNEKEGKRIYSLEAIDVDLDKK